jgi:1-acyl-sn-glycerol-3-phosphate acyltransferase
LEDTQRELDAHTTGPQVSRESLIGAVTKFLANRDDVLQEIQASLEREIDSAGPQALVRLGEDLAAAGADWEFYQRDPLARRLHHVLAESVLEPGSALFGIEHAHAVVDRPVVIFPNHLSYSDANLVEVLLHRSGSTALADRLTVIAGPKVYSSIKRRFSSLCFATIKTPQSSGVSSEDAVMNPREVARAARRCIEIAHHRLEMGDALLVFAEGRRSRTNGMQPMLAAAARYLEGPDVLILPVGITGTEAMFPIGEDMLHPVRAIARLGRPIESRILREHAGDNRQLLMDVAGLAVAALLPPEYQGAYADGVAGLDDARAIWSQVNA